MRNHCTEASNGAPSKHCPHSTPLLPLPTSHLCCIVCAAWEEDCCRSAGETKRMQLHEKTILTVNGWYSRGHSCIHAWILYASMHQCNCGSPRVLGITSYLQRIYKDSRDGELLPSFQGIFGTITHFNSIFFGTMVVVSLISLFFTTGNFTDC